MPPNKLQADIGKKNAFSSPEQEALLNLLRTNELFQNRWNRLFRKYQLTGSQYNVLRILRGEGKPMTCQQIVERMIHVVPAVTGLVDRLQARQLVTRDRSNEDRRVVYVEITKQALSLLKKLDRPLEQLHSQLLGHLTRSELNQLTHLLEKARQSEFLKQSP